MGKCLLSEEQCGFLFEDPYFLLTEAIEYVPTVTPMPAMRNTSATMANITPRLLAKREPTDETFLQCGQRARAL